MGQASPEEKERNMAIYLEYLKESSTNKLSHEIFAGLMMKYKISYQRIWQIIAREKKRGQK